jgi:hypothetical protein
MVGWYKTEKKPSEISDHDERKEETARLLNYGEVKLKYSKSLYFDFEMFMLWKNGGSFDYDCALLITMKVSLLQNKSNQKSDFPLKFIEINSKNHRKLICLFQLNNNFYFHQMRNKVHFHQLNNKDHFRIMHKEQKYDFICELFFSFLLSTEFKLQLFSNSFNMGMLSLIWWLILNLPTETDCELKN